MQEKWRQKLIAGYHNFKSSLYNELKQQYKTLGRDGQNPDLLIIACSDSRADPATIFNLAPGEAFTIRNIANIIPKQENSHQAQSVVSAIEYAVKVLKVEAILVMGHAQCGGIAAYVDGVDEASNIDYVKEWVGHLAGLDDYKCEHELHTYSDKADYEIAGVLKSLDNLTKYDFIQSAIESGNLQLVGGYFGIEQGKLFLTNANDIFEEI